MGAPLLTLDRVAMSYATRSTHEGGEHAVLREINLDLREGERLGVIGRNGAGKSTLLKVMAGVFAPVSGRVQWSDGVTVSLLSLGLGFRDDLTGRENAYLSALLQGISRVEARTLIQEIEAFCELGDYFDEPVKTYSSGMRARLGFAAGLLNRAQVLLIDEVLAVGDAEFRHKARTALLKQLDAGRGVVIVSHVEQQIRNLCNRVVWLEEGAIKMDGTPDEVLEVYTAAVS